MIPSRLIIPVFNRFIRANPQTQTKLRRLKGRVISLTMPFAQANFNILDEGILKTESTSPDCSITIPLAATAHLIHHQTMRTFKQIVINGNNQIAQDFLTAIATINPSNVLYQHDSPLLGIISIKLESIFWQIIAYVKLLASNMTLSTTEYIQYEANLVSDRYQLEQFYKQVDELNERCQLLTKRLAKLTRP